MKTKPEKKKLKPVRAWAVVTGEGVVVPFGTFAYTLFKDREGAELNALYPKQRVVRVLITELD